MKTRPSKGGGPDLFAGGFVQAVTLLTERIDNPNRYPFTIPAVRDIETLDLHPKVTYFVGENGSGKSTIVEGIAVAAGFNAEGGTKNFNFHTRRSESDLSDALQLRRGVRRETDGFFLRAESLYNVGTEIEELERVDPGIIAAYGGKSLHEQSHGESFLALMKNRWQKPGLFILDEPESALSPQRQLSLLRLIHDHVKEKRSQFIISTHSPILMAYPDARIYHLSQDGIRHISYEQTEHYRITRDFLEHREAYLRHLLT